MNSHPYNRRLALDRIDAFHSLPKVKKHVSRYASWIESEAGVELSLPLAFVAQQFIAGSITRNQYLRSVDKLAIVSPLPPDATRLHARIGYEFTRAALVGTGQVCPIKCPDVDPDWGLK